MEIYLPAICWFFLKAFFFGLLLELHSGSLISDFFVFSVVDRYCPGKCRGPNSIPYIILHRTLLSRNVKKSQGYQQDVDASFITRTKLASTSEDLLMTEISAPSSPSSSDDNIECEGKIKKNWYRKISWWGNCVDYLGIGNCFELFWRSNKRCERSKSFQERRIEEWHSYLQM